MDMNTHSKNREDDIRKQLKELEEICFGLYENVVPLEIENNDNISAYIESISAELAKESSDYNASSHTVSFYNAFYQTVLFYLLSMCNRDDQIFLSLIKLAETFSMNDYTPFSKTVLGILVKDINVSTLSENDKFFANKCLSCCEDFKRYYEYEMHPTHFFKEVDYCVRKYVNKQKYGCTFSSKKYSEVLRILKEACYEAYFSTYQRQEI